MDPTLERGLVEKAKESLKAFDQLYEYYLPRIFGFVYNRTGNKEIAEDITSQTFMKAMTKIKTFTYKGFTFGAWLYRIAHNNLIDFYRKNPHQVDIEMNRLESDENVHNDAEQAEKQEIILDAIRHLPEQYQQVLTLKYFEELTNEEIADILGCKKATLAVKLHRSLKALKKIMKKDGFLKLLHLHMK